MAYKKIYGRGGVAVGVGLENFIFPDGKATNLKFTPEVDSMTTNNGNIIRKTRGYRFSCSIEILNDGTVSDTFINMVDRLGTDITSFRIYPKIGWLPDGAYNLAETPNYECVLSSALKFSHISDREDMGQILNFNVKGRALLEDLPSYQFDNFPLQGSGTQAFPFLIQTIEDFMFLHDEDYLWEHSYYYKQTIAELDLTDTSMFLGGLGYRPIGTYENKFRGHYDGDNNVISNFNYSVTDTNDIGLFGICSRGSFRNMQFEFCRLIGSGDSERFGILVARTYYTYLRNINLYRCRVSAQRYTGGIVGQAYYTSMNKCSNNSFFGGGSSSVYAPHGSVGGLIGYADTTTLRDCWVRVEVKSSSSCGGLVGYLRTHSNIITSFSTGNVTTQSIGGGLTGYCDGKISNSYSRSNVKRISSTATGKLGGLTGFMGFKAEIINSFCTGDVVTGSPDTGGFIGLKDEGAESVFSFWDIDTSNWLTSTDSGEIGHHTTVLTTRSFYILWNFSTVWSMDNSGVINDGYPYLMQIDSTHQQ